MSWKEIFSCENLLSESQTVSPSYSKCHQVTCVQTIFDFPHEPQRNPPSSLFLQFLCPLFTPGSHLLPHLLVLLVLLHRSLLLLLSRLLLSPDLQSSPETIHLFIPLTHQRCSFITHTAGDHFTPVCVCVCVCSMIS